MKISVSRDDLLGQLQSIARVASTHSAVQTLSGVRIAATDDVTTLSATDLEVALQLQLLAKSERSGEAIVPARLLLDVVRSLPAGELTLEHRTAEQDVEITTGSARFDLRTLRSDDFPELPALGEEPVALPAEAFVAGVGTVARAASRDETRPVLTGILLNASGSELTMIATDSYRLAIKRTGLESALGGTLEANVPARAMQELARLATHLGAEELRVTVSDRQVVFALDGAVLSSRLIEGQFPNYNQLVPDSFEHELRFPAGELSEVVRRVALLAQRNAPVRLSFAEGELTVSAQTPDVGEASESMPAPFQGEALEIGFNPEFLRDGLESVEADDLLLKLIAPLNPGLIEAGDGSGYRYLIMPIRLNV